MKTNNLHCGACGQNFNDIKSLSIHLDGCRAAKTMLPLINFIWFLRGDKTGHPLSHLLTCLHRHGSLIQRYAYAVSDELDSLSRAKLHSSLCEMLHIKYEDFRPFESANIVAIPNREEALDILWNAIDVEIDKIKLR
jgi:hypothetical protein